MGDENTKPEGSPEPQPGLLQKKIVYAIIAVAIVILAVVLIAKFGFNMDLLSPAAGEMSLVQHQPVAVKVANITTERPTFTPVQVDTEDASLDQLRMQDLMQKQNEVISPISEVNVSGNDTIKKIINNAR